MVFLLLELHGENSSEMPKRICKFWTQMKVNSIVKTNTKFNFVEIKKDYMHNQLNYYVKIKKK